MHASWSEAANSMTRLHIVQGGIKNRDKALLERLAKRGGRVSGWVAPKSAQPGDNVVIYIGGYGFFATAIVDSPAKPRADWPNRYGADLRAITLIRPPISLAAVLRHIPQLAWARYPRSINTPDTHVAKKVRELIQRRRKTGLPDLDDDALAESNLEELRRVAMMGSRSSTSTRIGRVVYRARCLAIKLYVLRRADGHCEYCGALAPFLRPNDSPYLEPHHTTRLADDGPDHPSHVLALCPNCHRRAHHAADATTFNQQLKKLLRKLEPR